MTINMPTQPNTEKELQTRCYKCGIKVKSIDIIKSTCKCKEVFCKKHLFASIKDSDKSHLCTYDYFSDAKKEIQKTNPIVDDNKHRFIISD